MDKILLRRIMKQQGLTQEKLAERIGVDRSTFNRKVNGHHKGFCIVEVSAIGKVLQLSKEQMLNVFFNHMGS